MFRPIRARLLASAYFTLASFSMVASSEYKPDWDRLEKLDREALQKLSMDDPFLEQAYGEAFLLIFQDRPPSWFLDIQKDISRRGNEAAPVLLQLIDQHPLQQCRDEIFRKIEDYPEIDIAPFLDAARSYWETHKHTLPPRTCYAIAALLSRNGTEKDQAILGEMVDHPSKEVGFVIQPDIERMAKRLNGTLKPTEWTGRPPVGYQWPAKPPKLETPDAKPSTPSQEPTSSTPWSIIVVLVLAATGLLWLLVKKRK